jgi:transposase InsO family protein
VSIEATRALRDLLQAESPTRQLRPAWRSVAELRRAVVDHVGRLVQPLRLHSSLDQLSPAKWEAICRAAVTPAA